MIAWAALIIAVVALVVSATGAAGASTPSTGTSTATRTVTTKTTTRPRPRTKPKATTTASQTAPVVHLNSNGLIPAKLIGTVKQALAAEALTTKAEAALEKVLGPKLTPTCPSSTIDLGSWCVMPAPYVVPPTASGTNDFFYASQTCQNMGGYLPDAAQLIGAAPLISLESTLTDNPTTATVDTSTSGALTDMREMTSTLVTTSAGSDAAGSEGVSTTATGNPNENQPDPTPEPADPDPETLQYVTVYDNDNLGGFAGSEPVGQPENFRCGFAKVVGGASENEIPINPALARAR